MSTNTKLDQWLQKSASSKQPAPKRPRSEAGTSGNVNAPSDDLPDVDCCSDEKISRCSRCGTEGQQGHEKDLEKLKKMQTQFSQTVQKQEENNQEDLWKMVATIKKEAREAEDSSESAIVCVIDSLQTHFRSVRELIRRQEEAAVTQVQNLHQSLSVKLKEVKRSEAELHGLAETTCNVCLNEQWRLLCEKDLQQGFPELSQDSLLPFKRDKDAVEKLGERLQEFCDKEFASLSQIVHSGPTEPDVEPKTREEFLRYACELSLDPDTAHADLTISGGDKEVKNENGKRSAVPCNPDRFSHRRQVLCRTGLQAERCYYEVEVKGDKAEIALAYKGINRKSSSKQSGFGANAKSWSLDISHVYAVSHKSLSDQLTTSPTRHPRIGVYLEFKKGALSFYEVANDVKFLYKVQAKFTEPLYPAFWLEDNCSISICDLNLPRS